MSIAISISKSHQLSPDKQKENTKKKTPKKNTKKTKFKKFAAPFQLEGQKKKGDFGNEQFCLDWESAGVAAVICSCSTRIRATTTTSNNTSMSNKVCVELYTNIIEDVIVESRQDFENAGIDEQTLQDLKAIWQQKLLASKVASFPWAETEDDVVDGNAATASDAQQDVQQDAQQDAQPQGQVGQEQHEQQGQSETPFVKKEESDDDFGAVHNDKETKHENNNMNDLFQDNNNILSLPRLNQNDGSLVTYNSNIEKRSRKRTPVLKFSIRNNQVDGSFDFEDDDDNDNNKSSKSRANANNDSDDDDDDDLGSDLGSDLGADSDAINSELDDSDDDDDDDENDNDQEFADGDGAGNDIEQNIMLCLYDRVQRVRNRWKCSLKDGLMNINGKDYVFQKATGDSEW